MYSTQAFQFYSHVYLFQKQIWWMRGFVLNVCHHELNDTNFLNPADYVMHQQV